jgi:protein MAK11
VNSGKVAYCIDDAHSARVKGIVVLMRNDSTVDDPYLLASASSDGVIRVWDVRMSMKEKPNPLAEANTKSRLTCLAGSSHNVSTVIAWQMFSASSIEKHILLSSPIVGSFLFIFHILSWLPCFFPLLYQLILCLCTWEL